MHGHIAGMLNPHDLKKAREEKELAKLKEALDKKRQHDEELKLLHDQFMNGTPDLRPEAVARFNNRVRAAAENGESQLQVFRFPCSWLNDHGRRINSLDPDWPSSLEGRAKRAYEEVFKKVLEPQGYGLTAHVVSFKDGIPDECAIYLTW